MIILAMHGILTPRTDVTWPERLETYAYLNAPDCRILVDQYDAGPFPRINWLLGNPRMARGQARRMLNWLRDANEGRLALIGHSNGCEIVRQTAIMLAEDGAVVDAMILIAPPINPDMERNGIGRLIDQGSLGRVVCYASPNDRVMAQRLSWHPFTWLQAALRWPYGNAGRVGLDRGACVEEDRELLPGTRIATRWFTRYGHSTWFSPAVSHKTFKLILTDVQLDSETLRHLAQAEHSCKPCAERIETANLRAAAEVGQPVGEAE